MKIKTAAEFGYAIEIGKANAAAVPADYVRRQTLTNAERYVTPELRELDAAISGAQTRQQRLEADLFEALLERLAAGVDALLGAADALAHVDAFASLAQVASERGYVRPEFIDASTIDIVDGRHPVVEALLGPAFVPNDLHLHEERSRFIVLTGPNMGGKSTYCGKRLLVILAQVKAFVRQSGPARSSTGFSPHRAGDDPVGPVDVLR